jgi:3-deoxy-D-manno-octulosonic acid (KDO) 8-phosphate synthase
MHRAAKLCKGYVRFSESKISQMQFWVSLFKSNRQTVKKALRGSGLNQRKQTEKEEPNRRISRD